MEGMGMPKKSREELEKELMSLGASLENVRGMTVEEMKEELVKFDKMLDEFDKDPKKLIEHVGKQLRAMQKKLPRH
jgi:peptidoglycan hydrolase CwlO-like protein